MPFALPFASTEQPDENRFKPSNCSFKTSHAYYLLSCFCRHIALAFASMNEEPMDTEDQSQVFSEDEFNDRGLQREEVVLRIFLKCVCCV